MSTGIIFTFENFNQSITIFVFPNPCAMDDLLVELLTYDCPYTGKKRVAGCYDSPDKLPAAKYLYCK